MSISAVTQETKPSNELPLGDLLAYHARGNPTKPAITLDDEMVTYAELDRRATIRAHELVRLGVLESDIVTVSMPKSIEVYECLFAIWKLGATPNIVSERLPAPELRAIVDLAAPRLVIGPEADFLPGHRCLPLTEFQGLEGNEEPIAAKVALHWKIMTSGGSTGRPKLIVAEEAARYAPDNPLLLQRVNGVVLNPGPLYHNTPLSTASRCLFVGGHVIEMRRFDPLLTLQLIEKERVDWVSLVPTMMHRIWRLGPDVRNAFDLSSLHAVFHMAASCPIWLKENWIEWLGADRIFEVYGSTEGLGFCAISGEEWLTHKGSVGRILPGCRLRVIGDDGKDCEPGEVGSIYFLPDSGRGSTYSYVGATTQSIGDWETFGDLGSLDEEGYLYIADRRTDMIVSGGANIFPAEVEAAIDSYPAVISSLVIGLPDEDLGRRAHAIVQISPDDRATNDDGLREFLAARIVRYKIPRSFEFTDAPLRDDAGKARRSQLVNDRIDRPL